MRGLWRAYLRGTAINISRARQMMGQSMPENFEALEVEEVFPQPHVWPKQTRSAWDLQIGASFLILFFAQME